MTNEEKYKSIHDRVIAFRRHCKDVGCTTCDLNPDKGRRHTMCVDRCILTWLALEAQEEKLLPCPFCGSANIKVMPTNISGYIVNCDNCWAASRVEATKADAIVAWNRRVK